MTLHPAALLLGLAIFGVPPGAQAGSVDHAALDSQPARLRVAQAADTQGTAPADLASPQSAPTTSGTQPASKKASKGVPGSSNPARAPNAGLLPQSTGVTRNGTAAVRTPTQQGVGPTPPAQSSITYGGPQVEVQPVYGSTMRDSGAGNGGIPIYNSVPGQPGSPVNGTANPYYETIPGNAALPNQNGTIAPGQYATPGYTSDTLKPLGGTPYTRDQNGNLGGLNGYTAQGVYNGKAAQQNGIGYGSVYVQNGRPMGGLLGTGVDASGPLHPYMPLNTGRIGSPNSGYGIPNGSRPSRMDAQGIQRID